MTTAALSTQSAAHYTPMRPWLWMIVPTLGWILMIGLTFSNQDFGTAAGVSLYLAALWLWMLFSSGDTIALPLALFIGTGYTVLFPMLIDVIRR